MMETISRVNQKMIHQKIINFFIFLCFFCLFINNIHAQKVYAEKPFLPKKLLPIAFKNQLAAVNREFIVAYNMRFDSSARDVRNYNIDQIRSFIYKEKDYEYLFRCPFWIAADSARYVQLIPELVKAITDETFVGLTNAGDVTIWARIKTGELKQNPLNYQIDDDIFKVCGRANWILKRLSKNEFGNITMKTTMKELVEIQKKWVKWLNSLKVK
jgi:hypothetical protein